VTTHVPNGVRRPPSDIKSDEVEGLGLVPGGYLLYVGRLVPEKGADVLIRAFTRLGEEDLALVVVGRSGDSDNYVRLVRDLASTNPRVVVTGYVSSEQRDQLYAHARAVVFPSVLEGHPIALLEASSYGSPVVASAIGAHVEILGPEDAPGRRLFPPGDEDGLVAALGRSLRGGSAESAGAAEGRTQVLTRFDWAAAAARTEAAYFDALEARHH
jgi:glycosyltransferase involved in cell wall biosynthesis